MTKLTPTQMKVLTTLADGGTLHFMSGLDAYYFMAPKGGGHYGVRRETVDKLYTAKLIEEKKGREHRDPDFQITKAGRAALAQSRC